MSDISSSFNIKYLRLSESCKITGARGGTSNKLS